jgi:hypothetical protein
LLAEAILEDKLVVIMPFQEGLNGVNWLLKFAWIFDWQLTKYPNWQLRNDEKMMSQHFAVTDYWQLAMI